MRTRARLASIVEPVRIIRSDNGLPTEGAERAHADVAHLGQWVLPGPPCTTRTGTSLDETAPTTSYQRW